jgi:hypothetical protein
VGGATWKRCERPLLIALSVILIEGRRGGVWVRRVAESISNPGFRENVFGMGWIVFNLLAKRFDIRS